MLPNLPFRIRHYELVELIGKGGFAYVYRALNTNLGGPAAENSPFKLLRPELAADVGVRRRMLQEAHFVSHLSRHDHIVKLLDLVDEPPHLGLVMALVPGGRTLASRMEEGPIPVPELCRIGRETCSALAQAHAVGVIHRDLKPSNLLLDVEHADRVLVSDFGLARHLQRLRVPSHGGVLPEGGLSGTTPYMSPEQVREEASDERSDIFSLCVTLFEAATGRLPFRGATTFVVLRKILESPPDWEGTGADPGLRAVLEKGLEKDPRKRYQAVEMLGRHLQQLGREALEVAGVLEPTIVGRDAELSALLEKFHRASRIGGRSRTMLVTGEAGIGKTALVDELQRALGQPGVPFGRAVFSQGSECTSRLRAPCGSCL